MNRYIGKKVKSDTSIILSHISLQLGYTHESNGSCKTNKIYHPFSTKKSLMIKSYLYKSAYTISYIMRMTYLFENESQPSRSR